MTDTATPTGQKTLLMRLISLIPLCFALGFLAPTIAQALERIGWERPFGFPAIATGLVIGGGWGLVAQLRGRWI